MTMMFGRTRGAIVAGAMAVAATSGAMAQGTDHPNFGVARADILRLVPDATDIKLTRPGCSQDASARCMVCVVLKSKGQQRIGAVVVRQAEVEDNTLDPGQPPMTKDAEAALRALCKL